MLTLVFSSLCSVPLYFTSCIRLVLSKQVPQWQHERQLGTCWKDTFLGCTPDLPEQKFWGAAQMALQAILMRTTAEMAGWHHWLNGHDFEQTPGDGWRTVKPGMLQSIQSQRIRHDWATEQLHYHLEGLRKQQFPGPIWLLLNGFKVGPENPYF